MSPDYKDYGALVDLNRKYKTKFKPGWNESKTDTALLTVTQPSQKIGSRNTHLPWYELKVWNRPGVRAEYALEFAKIMSLPVHVSK